MSPYELFVKKSPDNSFLRSFGCLCYVSILHKDRNNFTPRPKPCVFVGYTSGYKGYKVLDLDMHAVCISRNVVFHESLFPFKTHTASLPTMDFFPKTIILFLIHDALDSVIPCPLPFILIHTLPLMHLHLMHPHLMHPHHPLVPPFIHKRLNLQIHDRFCFPLLGQNIMPRH